MTDLIEILGTVSSEGGPLIFGDAELLRSWRGVGDELEHDYGRACALFDNDPEQEGGVIAVGDGYAITWEMRGGGTADICRTSYNGLMIVRSWVNNSEDPRLLDAIATAPTRSSIEIGELSIMSGSIAILWAPEPGECILDEDMDWTGVPGGRLAVDGSALLVRMTSGKYGVTHDTMDGDWGSARRCRLRVV